MKRSRRKSDGETVSLFPFLAVLISTMGALLVLLVIIARQAQASAHEQQLVATDSQNQSYEDDQRQRAAIDAKVAKLTAIRDQATAGLTARREVLSHLEDHMRRMRDQLQQLRDDAMRRKKSGDQQSQDLKRREAELERIARQLAESQQLLAEAQENQNDQPVSHAIVPYDGANGTHRRPIYIECRGERIVIQPEGIELTERDFQEPLGPGNPLASLLRAHSQYVRTTNGGNPSERPYPLLVVRPSGIGAYYAARAAMQSWESEFGYELVGEDWDLHYPTPDPKLARILYESVELARRRHQMLVRQAHEEQRRAAQRRPQLNQSRPGHPGFGRLVENPQAGSGLSDQTGDDGQGSGSGTGHGSGSGTGAQHRPFGARPTTSAPSDSANGTPSETGTSSGNPTSESSEEQGNSPPPMAEVRGKDWALPGASHGSVPILRPIHVTCSNDQLTIVPRNGRGQRAVIPLEGNSRDAIETFVSAVWEHMKGWGVAGRGLYWKPTINLYVQPGGAARAAEISTLLKDSGLEVNHAK